MGHPAERLQSASELLDSAALEMELRAAGQRLVDVPDQEVNKLAEMARIPRVEYEPDYRRVPREELVGRIVQHLCEGEAREHEIRYWAWSAGIPEPEP